jgi:transposase
MNEPLSSCSSLPGLEAVPTRTSAQRPPGRPRVKPVDRSQLVWRMVDMEGLIEADHPARAIWALSGELDLQRFYAPIEAVAGVAGRPPWDPRLLASLWLYAYSRGISSAREIARRCGFDPAFQWLCGLELVNHHTLSDFRTARPEGLAELFTQVLGVLSAQGLVSLERVMHDGTKIKACASADTFRSEQRLVQHLQAAHEQVQALTQKASEETPRPAAAQARAARERQQRVEQALEQLRALQQTKRGSKEKESVRVSTSDPEARTMKQADGGYAPSYNVQLSTEASHKIIVGAGVSQSGNDYGELVPALERVERNLGTKPSQVVVDGGFTSRANVLALQAQGIDLVGSLVDKEPTNANPDPQFCTQAFEYDSTQDRYRCPAGHSLRAVGQRESRAGVVQHQYRAQKAVCAHCSFKARCCANNQQGRTLSVSVEAPQLRQFRQKMQTPEAREIYRQRGAVAEFPNAWIKAKLGLRQFRLRGLVKVGLETLWACLTYNVQQWIRLCWRPALAGSES